jgi:outer membrane lipoprotein-sorting protein
MRREENMKKNCKRVMALLLAMTMLFMLGCTQNTHTQPSTEDFSEIPEGFNQLVLYWD